MKAKITALVWDSYSKSLHDAADELGIEVVAFTRMMVFEDPSILRKIEEDMRESAVVLIHLMGSDLIEPVASIVRRLPDTVPVLSMGHDPMAYVYTTGPKDAAIKCQEYLGLNGRANCRGCLLYLMKRFMGRDVEVPPPVEIPWHGIVDPSGERYGSLEDYLREYREKDAPWIGIVGSRAQWNNDNSDVEYGLYERFEKRGYNVIMVYGDGHTDPDDCCGSDTDR